MRQSPRTRRLVADYQALHRLQDASSIFTFRHQGAFPELYDVHFRGIGLWQLDDGQVVPRDFHHVRIELGTAYPRMIPALSWRTPVFHPNISTNGVVCLGGYSTFWVPSLKLDELCIMLWDMIRFKNFDVNSPYNREAALWARDQAMFDFPLDRRGLRDRISGELAPYIETAALCQADPPPILGHANGKPQAPAALNSLSRPAPVADIVYID